MHRALCDLTLHVSVSPHLRGSVIKSFVVNVSDDIVAVRESFFVKDVLDLRSLRIPIETGLGRV